MNNLTQTQIDAKQAFLNRQQETMLAHYQTVEPAERSAIIRQIDSFLPVISKDQKIFWLEFRQKLEMIAEQKSENSRILEFWVGI